MRHVFRINFDNHHERDSLFGMLERARGYQKVTLEDDVAQRSRKQLRLYWVYIRAFRIFLAEQGEPKSEAYLHHLVGLKLFPETILDPKTLDVVGVVPRSLSDAGDVSVKEMNEILDNLRAYLIETYGIEALPDREEFFGQDGQ